MAKFEPDKYLVMISEKGVIINAFNVVGRNYANAHYNANKTIEKLYRKCDSLTMTINKVV